MAQLDIPSCSLKGKEIHNGEVNVGGQTQCNASAKSWLIQVKSTLNSSHKIWQVSKNVCIYRVPKEIMISKPEAYVPLVVSFGPYHHNTNPQLSMMDHHKLEALRRMLSRLQIDVTILIEEIQKLECEIRECYEEPIDLDGEALSWMLAMDACFILECFNRESRTDNFSLIFQGGNKKNSVFFAILDDIMKLENQIPLFILITLLQLEFGTPQHATTELAAMLSTLILFDGHPFCFSSSDNILKLKNYLEKKPPPCHLLDLCRMVIKDLLTNSSVDGAGADNINNEHGRCGWSMNVVLPGWMERLSCIDILPRLFQNLSPDDRRSTPSAELLHKAGINFKPGQIGFKKRRFGKSTLSLPRISIEDSTETRLRNLMAYEESERCLWSSEDNVISHFVRLLDDLIDSEKDVSVLRKSLVIKSWVGSDEEIARMFNRLSDGITCSSIEKFEVVMKEARVHYNSQWKVWMSQFKNERCSKPWYVVSLVAAILILGMTAVQTVYSVKK